MRIDGYPSARNIVLLTVTVVLLSTGCQQSSLTDPAVIEPTMVSSTIEWSDYASTPAATKFTPIDQIRRDNFQQLEVAWRWVSPDQERLGLQEGLWAWAWESTPLMLGDTLYTSTSFSQVAAIDARTGATHWIYDPLAWKKDSPSKWFMHRGVAVLREDQQTTVFVATNDARLIALDSDTGQPRPGFGTNGEVDLTQGMRRPADPDVYTMSSPPVICNDVVVVGSSITDFENRKRMPPGDVRGFDPHTGEQLWVFESIPQPGSFGHDTWEGDSWEITGNTNVWTYMSCDPALGLVYLPFGTANSDLYGGHRKGANLFAESIVALDAATGERAWHFQVLHHGLWDYDLPAAPVLADIVVEGQSVQALAQVTKQGFVFVLDRRTGEPVWPIEEHIVPQSGVPGEASWPTQPMPSKPLPFDRQGLSQDDLIDFTPELRAESATILENYSYGPIYTPPGLRDTIVMPGWSGGASWAGAALNPTRGILYVPSQSSPSVMRMEQPAAGTSDLAYIGVVSGIKTVQGLPLFKPPWGRITAIDLNTGEHLWTAPMGEGPRHEPPLAGLNLPRLGWARRGFPLLTPTLLLVAQEGKRNFQRTVRGDVGTMQLENSDPNLMAYDPQDGTFLGNVELPGNASGSPMSYYLEGRQYIVVAIGGGNQPAELVALALPAE